MRAITVEINEFSGLAGHLAAGCRVDVVSTIQGEAGETLSRTIVQNVEVRAIGRRNPDNDGQPEQVKSVTLLVKPKEAEAIELAAATGRPRLVLRGSGDNSDATSIGITVAELRGRAQQKKNDPWGLPVELFTPRPTTPTTPSTQPVAVSPVIEMLPPPTRTIKVIRAGRESEVILELPRPDKQPKWITDAK
jgi:Flp pilus assembly protein CpaB